MCVGMLLFFFFQGEDGIRDLVRSRGLGDVYKRQNPDSVYIGQLLVLPAIAAESQPTPTSATVQPTEAVSYTHLTLPTSDLV